MSQEQIIIICLILRIACTQGPTPSQLSPMPGQTAIYCVISNDNLAKTHLFLL